MTVICALHCCCLKHLPEVKRKLLSSPTGSQKWKETYSGQNQGFMESRLASSNTIEMLRLLKNIDLTIFDHSLNLMEGGRGLLSNLATAPKTVAHCTPLSPAKLAQCHPSSLMLLGPLFTRADPLNRLKEICWVPTWSFPANPHPPLTAQVTSPWNNKLPSFARMLDPCQATCPMSCSPSQAQTQQSGQASDRRSVQGQTDQTSLPANGQTALYEDQHSHVSISPQVKLPIISMNKKYTIRVLKVKMLRPKPLDSTGGDQGIKRTKAISFLKSDCHTQKSRPPPLLQQPIKKRKKRNSSKARKPKLKGGLLPAVIQALQTPKAVLLLLLWALCMKNGVQASGAALTVYDVTGHHGGVGHPSMKTISLMEVAPCTKASRSYFPPEEHEVQILKKLTSVGVPIIGCKLELSTSVAYCGWDGFFARLWPSVPIEDNLILPITGDQCSDAHAGRAISLTVDRAVISVVMPENLTRTQIEEATLGSRTSTSSCTGADFSFRNKFYPSSVKISKLVLSLTKEQAEYDEEDRALALSREKIVLHPHQLQRTPRSGILYGTDQAHGTFCLDLSQLPTTDCGRVDEVFRGSGKVFSPVNVTSDNPTIILVENEEEGQEISLTISGMASICKRQAYKTSQKNLHVTLLSEHNLPFAEELRQTRVGDLTSLDVLRGTSPLQPSTTYWPWTRAWHMSGWPSVKRGGTGFSAIWPRLVSTLRILALCR